MPKTPIDPVADIAAMVRERGISDHVLWHQVRLSDITERRVAIPQNPQHLRTLAHHLKCQPFYLIRLIQQWNAYQAAPAVEPEPAPAPPSDWRAVAAQKTAERAAKRASMPARQCTQCGVEKAEVDYYARDRTCRTCRLALNCQYKARQKQWDLNEV